MDKHKITKAKNIVSKIAKH